ncbi:hypothetical protein CK203_014135 [Vitis vinifera]|uniref:Uncharacterized protein n=1 Tax=Vitis vinifera TaxID=29760 RepID=A0A438JHP9_VITVI|nr:hypothetical protein CK203_014135 [Vitis vinifera]
MLPRLSSLLANSILVNELYVLGIVLRMISAYSFMCPPIRVKRAACTRILCACLGSSEGLACTWIGNRMASLVGREAAIRPRRQRAVIRSLETDSARARSNPDRMASYSASLLDAENPSRMACSRCSPVGDCNKSPTPEPDEREAPSTRRVHHSVHLIRVAGRVFVNIRARTFAQLNLACVECYEGAGRSVQSLGELENRGGAFEQHFEELRLLAPFLNTWFLHLPKLC